MHRRELLKSCSLAAAGLALPADWSRWPRPKRFAVG